MNEKRALFAASFSLLLPGLGQLYLRRPGRALCLFAAFALLYWMPFGRWLVLALAPFAAVEAYRRAKQLDLLPEPELTGVLARERHFVGLEKDRYRLPAFIGVGVVSFTFWFGSLYPSISPMGAQGEINDDAYRLGSCLKARKTTDIGDCVSGAEPELANDPWGSPYWVEETDGMLLLRSSGPDRERGTSDDFTYRF